MNALPIVILIGVVIVIVAVVIRRRAGFGFGTTVSHDNVTLSSDELGLIGRPDRIVKRGKYFIPEDKKLTARLFDNHRAQMGVYLILVENHYRIRPPYGIIVLANGKRKKIPNTAKLRAWVLDINANIRRHRFTPNEPLKPVTTPAKCRGCGQRNNCEQRLA